MSGISTNYLCTIDDMEKEDIQISKQLPSLKIGHPKRKLVFQPSIVRCELLVSGRVYCCSSLDVCVVMPILEETIQLLLMAEILHHLGCMKPYK